MKYSDIPGAQTIVAYCQAYGIKNIVISPGSRNAPLTLGFTKNTFFNCYSIVDERCAAFFALGMSNQLQEPTALVCTSGSAVLNYYPAVAEAFYGHVPLVVISADRPQYKIDIGDGQTIRQENILEKHIGYSANLKQDVCHASEVIDRLATDLRSDTQEAVQQFNSQEIRKALTVAISQKLPVHINAPFEEPLYGTVKGTSIEIPEMDFYPKKNETYLSELLSLWHHTKRKMVLVGVNRPEAVEQKHIERLGEDESVVVLTETTSNLHHEHFFASIDSIIAPIEMQQNREEIFERLRPELLLTFGGMIVSKKIKAFLRRHRPKYHYHIGYEQHNDTFFSLTQRLEMVPQDFFEEVFKNTKPLKSSFRNNWSKFKIHYHQKRPEYLKQVPFSDFSVFSAIVESIPGQYQAHFANSSAIRYSQLFDIHPSVKMYCNRGTSGIEGSTSTAVGASIHNGSPTLLVTGDLGFFYDGNALWNNYIRPDFRIIVVNNSGGGIFRILPGAENTEEFATYFETRHSLTAQQTCDLYGFEYIRANGPDELSKALKQFYKESNEPKLLEVFTPTELNDKILLAYFDFLSSKQL